MLSQLARNNINMTPRSLQIVLTLFLISLTICASHGLEDSITINQSLSGDQKLTSKGGNFVLGFFTKDKYTSSSRSRFYIGIWYKRVSVLTPVWVANRATPVLDPTKSLLHISGDDGNLVLEDQLVAKSLIIWSTNATISSQYSTVVVLQDDGNLVLRDVENSSNVFWQSNENPTHTWLPGAKISFNKRTGRVSQRLTSWKNSGNPAPGLFSYEMGQNGEFLIKWNMSKTYWTTGPWDGRSFSQIPQMTEHRMSDYTFVNSSEEIYFFYSIRDNATIGRVIMDVSGQMKMLMWAEAARAWTQISVAPQAQCQVTAFCGPFGSCNEQSLQHKCTCLTGFSERSPKDWDLSDFGGGCTRNTPLQCTGGNTSNYVEQDKFLRISSVRLPIDAQQFQAGNNNVDECEQACLNNCSCTAYSYGTSTCSLWYGDLFNLQDQYDGEDGGTVHLRLAASELPIHHNNRIRVTWIIIAGGVAACFVGALVVWVLVKWRRRERSAWVLDQKGSGLVVFRYSDLQRVTHNFSDKLGAGSFGSVFKGMLPDSTVVAVKKLEGIRQGEKQFRAEVSTLGTIQHVNLVPLRGFCAEGTERLLVFDYMPHGSLDSHLFHRNTKVLDWATRYRIALGIARGLAYLHEKCRECIIHCDIKPENILLDAAFNPIVADFGLAKLLGREFSHVLTTLRGTIGYLAPEWISGLAITPKADVYSFGMMLLEIISGKRNTKQYESGADYFPVKAAIQVGEGRVDCLLDGRLQGDANMDELNIACRVACWCIQDMESERPTMGMVVQMLEGLLEVSIPPISALLQDLVVHSGAESKDMVDHL